ncbi:MAG: AAA family ATPase [Planctomycetota bacterium]|jgi:predicted kinase
MNEKERTVYLTIGFLGSGKSTWAKKFAAEHPDTKIVSGDGFRTMLNGEYKYLVELDDIITESMRATALMLLQGGYNVIIDVGNLTEERRSSWMSLPYRKVAIVLPKKDKTWHINNRLRKEHRDDADWDKIAQGERDAYEWIDLMDYDSVVNVREWKDE